ncbi:MAG: hypothetical protein ACRDQZ_14035, partial [Mycobacteriales bacterium]
SIDANKIDQALHFYQQTLIQARINDNATLEVRCMTSMGMLTGRIRPREILQISQAAQRISASWATPKLRSILHLRAASAYADMQDEGSTKEELAKALTELDRGDHDNDLNFTKFMNHGEIAGITGLSYISLGRPAQASGLFREITESPDPDFQRNTAYYNGHLANSLLEQGDLDAAAEAGIKTIKLSQNVASARVEIGLRKLRRDFGDNGRRSAKVKDFITEYEEVISA